MGTKNGHCPVVGYNGTTQWAGGVQGVFTLSRKREGASNNPIQKRGSAEVANICAATSQTFAGQDLCMDQHWTCIDLYETLCGPLYDIALGLHYAIQCHSMHSPLGSICIVR